MSVIEVCTGYLFIVPDQSLKQYFIHAISTQVALFPTIVICLLYFENNFRDHLGYDPQRVPFWLPINRETDALQALLPPNKRGKVLQLSAANQYVEIKTTNGSHEVRATLKSLLDHLPKGEGLHLHRSYWLNKDQILEFRYENGNPFVVNTEGTRVPVSRKMAPHVKKMMDARTG